MLIAVDKPVGPTSHDIVAAARRQLGTRRVGHAGTLDPLASGVLLLLSDVHTRLSSFLTASNKSYLAWVSFGGSTPTLDAEGPFVPGPGVPDADGLAERITDLLPGFLALTEQVPPSYSAVKQAGVKGYEAARRGESLEHPPRPAGYRSITLLATADSPEALPRRFSRAADGRWLPDPQGREFTLPAELVSVPGALLSLEVQAGTYIRSFARDLGEQLGCGAFLSGLVRTAAGRLSLDDTVPADALAGAAGLDPLDVLPFPGVQLSEEEANRIRLGQRLPVTFSGTVALLAPDGSLAAIAEATEDSGGRMKLLAVFPAPSDRDAGSKM